MSPYPSQIKVSKTAIAGLAEQKDIYLPIARKNMVNWEYLKPQMIFLDAVYYGDFVPIYQFEDLPSDESVYEEEIETDSDGYSTESE